MNPSQSTAPGSALFVLLFSLACVAFGRFALEPRLGAAPEQCGDPRRSGGGAGCAQPGEPLRDGRRWLFGAKVPLASATERDLVAIPGVGPALARRILDERRRRGGFKTLNELRSVHGVGPVLQARLGAALEVEEPGHGAGLTGAPGGPPSPPGP